MLVSACASIILAACGGGGGASDESEATSAELASAESALAARTRTTTPTPNTTSTSPTGTTWTRCAEEYGTCNFTGSKEVRYGYGGKYSYKVVTGPVACDNTVFGDPYPGATKTCDYATPPTTTTTTPPATTSPTWTYCADEYNTCTFSGTREVRYGADGKYAYRTATGSILCDNTVFGDPAVGALKRCEYSSTTTTSTTSPTAPTSPTTTTPTSPTTTTPGTRDPLKWPFASNSIWNMPIGSNAVYVPANMPAIPGNNQWAGMPGIDDEIIILRPTAPLTDIYYSDAAWTGKNRCAATGGLLMQAPIPSDYVIPHGGGNNSATILAADKRTLLQTQPLTRCNAGGTATSNWKFANADLYGDGRVGSHGGSHLSAIGGTIRLGELRPGQQGPKHALKVNVYAKQMLYKCTVRTDCFRWPASTADNYAVGWYGTYNNNSNTAMKMGSLLAIPASVNLANLQLETEPARQLAWTLQNYGAYIVDDAYWTAFEINVETGPDGSFSTQFEKDYGFKFLQYLGDNSPWTRDIQKLTQALHVVNNNSATSIGGGGTPRQPLAPPLQ